MAHEGYRLIPWNRLATCKRPVDATGHVDAPGLRSCHRSRISLPTRPTLSQTKEVLIDGNGPLVSDRVEMGSNERPFFFEANILVAQIFFFCNGELLKFSRQYVVFFNDQNGWLLAVNLFGIMCPSRLLF